MLQTISWMQCLGGIALVTGGYYTVVMFRFFRKELWALVKRLAGGVVGRDKGPEVEK